MRLGKRKLLLLVVLAACGVIAVAWCLLPSREPVDVSQASYDRIEIGMTLAEVEVIIGSEAGDFRDKSFKGRGMLKQGEGDYWNHAPPGSTMHEWHTNNGNIRIWLDRDGRVAGRTLDLYHGQSWRTMLPNWMQWLIP